MITVDGRQAALFQLTPHRTELREMSPAELGRYLDFCSDILSMISKVAALLVQHFGDSVVLAAVNEIETLTNGLSRKVWQKITILERPSLSS